MEIYPLYLGSSLYYNFSYIWLIIPAMLIALAAQIAVKRAYSSMSQVYSKSGYSGAQAASAVLRHYGITDVRIEQCSGKLSDHYDPKHKVIRLSEGVYSSTSIAAIGIACHEAGHAAQHAESYAPIKVRNLILPVCNIGSTLSMPLLIAGVLFGYEPLVWIGIGFFSFVALFQLITLPVEFNASKRALSVIESNGLLSFEEKNGAAKVLKMAAMTYVAALATSIAQILRLVLLYGGRRNRR